MIFETEIPPKTSPADFYKYIMKTLIDWVAEKKIKLLLFPNIENIVVKDGKLIFNAEIIERPKVKLCTNYFKIPIKRKFKEIPEEDIEKVLSFLKTAHIKEVGKEFTDDEYAKKLGHFNAETFKSALRLEMFKEKEKENRLDAIEQIKEYLLKNCIVNIPSSTLKILCEENYQEEVNRWLAQGNKLSSIPKDGKKKVFGNTRNEICFRVILDEIIDKEKLFGANPYLQCIEKLLEEAEYN